MLKGLVLKGWSVARVGRIDRRMEPPLACPVEGSEG